MPTLKKTLTLPALIIYGIGNILGAGIYAIIGEVAQTAGTLTWLAFGVAFIISFLTGLNYAELVSKYPKSGAEAYFLYQAVRRVWLSSLIGWLALCACIVTVATLSYAFIGYLKNLWPNLPEWPILIGFILLMGLINFWGIQESSRINMVVTAIECSGLLIVIIAGIFFFTTNHPLDQSQILPKAMDLEGVFQGAALAFFAFIGFEGLVNVAEEAKKPKRHLPYAILIALVSTGALYMIISWISTQVISPEQLASSSPLAEVVKASGFPISPIIFSLIALFAVANTALLNSITASRLLYGMSRQDLLPKIFQSVHAKRQTPSIAIITVVFLAVLLALSASFSFLAGTTSMILLIVFSGVSLSLLILKIRKSPQPKLKKSQFFRVPIISPILSVIGNIGLMFFLPGKSQIAAAVVMVVGLIVLGIYRRLRKQP